MEIYRPSIKGDWKEIDGKTYFVYTDGCFLGLQVLGDKKEPCFEGAGFFSLFNSLQQIKDQIDDERLGRELEEIGQRVQEYELKKLQQSGGTPMPQLDIYKLSHSDTERKLFELLNPPVEEGQEIESYTCLCQVYDKYAVVVVYSVKESEPHFERVYYTKNDETDTVEITSREVCYIMDVNEQEKRILNSLYEKHDNSYEAVAASYEKLESDCEKFSQDLNTKKEECEQLKSTFSVEKDRITADYEEKISAFTAQKNNEIATITAERDELAQFKLQVETDKKMNIIHSYEDKLPSDIIDKYIKELTNYSEEQLDMYLTYEVKKHNPSAFSTQTTTVLIPKDKPLTGIEAILAPYRDRK